MIFRTERGEQRCLAGDWLVDNGTDVYTVNQAVFARTYREVSPGRFEKHSNVWAEVASSEGVIESLEGPSAYGPGDYLVFNDRDRQDGWSMSAERFAGLYEALDSDSSPSVPGGR